MHSAESRTTEPFSPAEEKILLRIARESIAHALRTGEALEVDPAAFPPALRELHATFVTLRRRDGTLRGCLGELEPTRPLIASVVDRARAAAFDDPRFHPLAANELDEIELHVSVLGRIEPIAARSEEELLAALRPGIDGLLIDDGVHRATFLPAVWESLREPKDFLRELRRKAGMPERSWPATLRAWRYPVLEFAEA